MMGCLKMVVLTDVDYLGPDGSPLAHAFGPQKSISCSAKTPGPVIRSTAVFGRLAHAFHKPFGYDERSLLGGQAIGGNHGDNNDYKCVQ
jgi:hypothetical protein